VPKQAQATATRKPLPNRLEPYQPNPHLAGDKKPRCPICGVSFLNGACLDCDAPASQSVSGSAEIVGAATGDEEEDNGDELSEVSSLDSCDGLPNREWQETVATAANCIETCTREEADNAASLKLWLKERFGASIASVVLLGCTEKVLRKSPGGAHQRMLVGVEGQVIRLRTPAGTGLV
jgi:hypothetical protein